MILGNTGVFRRCRDGRVASSFATPLLHALRIHLLSAPRTASPFNIVPIISTLNRIALMAASDAVRRDIFGQRPLFTVHATILILEGIAECAVVM